MIKGLCARYSEFEDVPLMKQAGAEMLRVAFPYENSRPSQPDEWKEFDQFIEACETFGMPIMPCLTTDTNGQCKPNTISKRKIFAGYAERFATRYQLKRYEIWNEPNGGPFVINEPGTKVKTSSLVMVLRDLEQGLRKADPGCKIITGGLMPKGSIRPIEFFQQLYRAGDGIRSCFDGVGLHPYGSTPADSVDRTREVRNTLNALRDVHTPLWLTEFGWGDKAGTPTAADPGEHVLGEDALAAAVLRTIRAYRRLSGPKQLNVAGLFLYRWKDELSGVQSWPDHAGIVKLNGEHKPSYEAFQVA